MKGVPDTSTTLLRDVASCAKHARWSEFVSRYRGMMEAYLATHFPFLEADDIVQETLIALMAALPNYRYDPIVTGHFRNYLTGILRNKALNRCEKMARDSMLMEKFLQMAPDAQSNDTDGTEQWHRAVYEIAMRQLLDDEHIHERSKQIFLRVAVDGQPPETVAADYGVTRNVVDKIKSRLIARLREIVRKLETIRDDA